MFSKSACSPLAAGALPHLFKTPADNTPEQSDV
jgi:hypothetical protein